MGAHLEQLGEGLAIHGFASQSRFNVLLKLGKVGLHELGNGNIERIGWIGFVEQMKHSDECLGEGNDGTVVISQNIQTHTTSKVNIRMVDLGQARDKRLKRN